MARILAAVFIVAALLFAFAAPCHAKSSATQPRLVTRIKDKVDRFTSRHAGKIAVGSVFVAGGATMAAFTAQGVPLKLAAGGLVLGSLYSAARNGIEFALNHLVITR